MKTHFFEASSTTTNIYNIQLVGPLEQSPVDPVAGSTIRGLLSQHGLKEAGNNKLPEREKKIKTNRGRIRSSNKLNKR